MENYRVEEDRGYCVSLSLYFRQRFRRRYHDRDFFQHSPRRLSSSLRPLSICLSFAIPRILNCDEANANQMQLPPAIDHLATDRKCLNWA